MSRTEGDPLEIVRAQQPSQRPPTLYKYVTANTARIVLSDRTLRFQSPLNFNDPFDTQWDVLWELKSEEAMEHHRALLTRSITDLSCWPADADNALRSMAEQACADLLSLPPEQRGQQLNQLVHDMVDTSEADTMFRERLRDICRRLRLFCVSEVDDSLLMWSHYADYHRGVVLGFRTESFVDQYRVAKVVYPKRFPSIFDSVEYARSEVFGLPDHLPTRVPRMAEALVLTKHADWDYEREWRVRTHRPSVSPGNLDDLGFDAPALVEIITGCRTAESEAEELDELARTVNPRVRRSKMTAHPSEFALVKMPYKSP